MTVSYSNATARRLNQHIRRKYNIAQIYGLEDSLPEASKYPDVQDKISHIEVVTEKKAEVQI